MVITRHWKKRHMIQEEFGVFPVWAGQHSRGFLNTIALLYLVCSEGMPPSS